MIFSRRRGGGGRHHRVDDARGTRRPGTERAYDGSRPVDEASQSPTSGPYDVTEAPAGVERLDLGSMWIPAVPGVELRVQADPEGQIQQVILVAGESALQLGVFAAPRSEGIWDEVREEIRKQLFNDGVAAEEVDGRYGVELRSRVRTPEGFTDIRFVGVDGPRWMVRGVYQGAAAVDPEQAGPLAECLDGLVVDRGNEAMPVREPLPLRLPREMAEQGRHADDTADASLETADPVGVEPAGARPAAPSPRRSKPSPRPRGRA
ncbi:DUF3710 domain-containing protein [Planosporangium mesophilum]|uniref:DUF3710 domain-containing protein n=1 Tax=Planosporangium mesophilum TaxID=689768 RepID=A0A8J3WYE9_9ACTN|nr:DUF3710 domain-containing protein [Planosporangium mesophilum]GII20496.1 hypothetical protein Pme01_00930 [Planosporangium mesophilum]